MSRRTYAVRAAVAAAIAAGALAAPSPAPAADPSTGGLVVSNERTRTFWSYVYSPVSVRAAPTSRGRRTGRVRPETWYGLPEVVLVLRSRDGWSKVRYAGIGRRVGWVPARALSRPRLTRSYVVISRARRTLTAYRNGRFVMRTRVGVGARGSPTPGGRFYIRERLVPANRRGIYGVLAFGLSAYSKYRTDWPGGGQVGIHGTNQPGLIPGRISNGCVRLRNAAIRKLDRFAGPGTPVRVR